MTAAVHALLPLQTKDREYKRRRHMSASSSSQPKPSTMPQASSTATHPPSSSPLRTSSQPGTEREPAVRRVCVCVPVSVSVRYLSLCTCVFVRKKRPCSQQAPAWDLSTAQPKQSKTEARAALQSTFVRSGTSDTGEHQAADGGSSSPQISVSPTYNPSPYAAPAQSSSGGSGGRVSGVSGGVGNAGFPPSPPPGAHTPTDTPPDSPPDSPQYTPMDVGRD